jgi:hypothetical protein
VYSVTSRTHYPVMRLTGYYLPRGKCYTLSQGYAGRACSHVVCGPAGNAERLSWKWWVRAGPGRGVCAPALEPRGEWEGSRTRCQDFKPDLGTESTSYLPTTWRGIDQAVVRGTRDVVLRARREIAWPMANRLRVQRPSYDVGSSVTWLGFRNENPAPGCN